jgi:GNAT superfamily N-acetyltransferase
MNFRSAVVFGAIEEVTDPEEKLLALHALVEQMAPGRMSELGRPSPSELAKTLVLRLTIEEASAKVRQGDPLDAPADYELDVWAGVIPLALRAGPPIRDPLARSAQLVSSAAGARAARDSDPVIEQLEGDYLFSSAPSRIDFELVLRFLAEQSYWARDITAQKLSVALQHSLCFGIYLGAQQLAFARVVSDRSRFAYLCDVFVVAQQRGRGLGRRLIEFVLAHPSVRDSKRMLLGTRDAHPFYERMGWRRDEHGRFMELSLESAR